MAGDWRLRPLGELTENLDSIRVPVKEADRRSGPYAYYGASGVVDYVDDYLFDGEYLLIAEDGENLRTRTTPIAFLARGKFWVNNHAHIVRGNSEADTRFLMYALAGTDISGYLTGSTMPKLTQGNMNHIPVPAPPPDLQRAIAHILGTLDDKIELNRRTNKTLEEIARALFKSWFVDFDPVRARAEGRDSGLPKPISDLFPGSFGDSELGKIPEGWTVKACGDVADRIAMGPFGSSIKVETFVPNGVPIISGQHLRGLMLEDTTFNFVAPEHALKLSKANVTSGDVVFTHAGNIGQVAFIPDNARYTRYVISQRQFFLRCDRSQMTPAYLTLYFGSETGRQRLLANTSSSGVPSIARPVTYLRSLSLVVPPRTVLEAFDRLVQPLFKRMRHNKDSSRTLAALRDALLPKLISGELRVKDAERHIEAQT